MGQKYVIAMPRSTVNLNYGAPLKFKLLQIFFCVVKRNVERCWFNVVI